MGFENNGDDNDSQGGFEGFGGSGSETDSDENAGLSGGENHGGRGEGAGGLVDRAINYAAGAAFGPVGALGVRGVRAIAANQTPEQRAAAAAEFAANGGGRGLLGGQQGLANSQLTPQQQEAQRMSELDNSLNFTPYTLTSGAGTYGRGGNKQNAALEQAQQNALAGANRIFSQQQGVDELSKSIYDQQAAQLQPQFQQQNAQMQQSLFGSGRLGLRLAGEGVGAGAGAGHIQPDAFGALQAQNQTLAGLQTDSRNQALNQLQTQQQIGSGLFNNALQGYQLEGANIDRAAALENQYNQTDINRYLALTGQANLEQSQAAAARAQSQAESNQRRAQNLQGASQAIGLFSNAGGGDWLSGLFKGGNK